jgi:hypothetical protein
MATVASIAAADCSHTLRMIFQAPINRFLDSINRLQQQCRLNLMAIDFNGDIWSGIWRMLRK